MKKQQLILAALALIASGIGNNAYCLDYEAKPIRWCLTAPFKTMGAVTGGLFCGVVSGPIDYGYHGALKGTKDMAAKFGNEKGTAELLAAAPLGGTAGMLTGGFKGMLQGVSHGAKLGWEKPFNRKSYLMEEE